VSPCGRHRAHPRRGGLPRRLRSRPAWFWGQRSAFTTIIVRDKAGSAGSFRPYQWSPCGSQPMDSVGLGARVAWRWPRASDTAATAKRGTRRAAVIFMMLTRRYIAQGVDRNQETADLPGEPRRGCPLGSGEGLPYKTTVPTTRSAILSPSRRGTASRPTQPGTTARTLMSWWVRYGHAADRPPNAWQCRTTEVLTHIEYHWRPCRGSANSGPLVPQPISHSSRGGIAGRLAFSSARCSASRP